LTEEQEALEAEWEELRLAQEQFETEQAELELEHGIS